MLTLDVAISTYRPEGIRRVEKMLPDPQEGVRYIVSWQEHENSSIPDSIGKRKDVEVFRYEVKGLSNNRNNAIQHSTADLILVADDDLIFEADFVDIIRNAFLNSDNIDLGIFKVKFQTEKQYPGKNCKLTLPLPKNYYCSSVEIAFKREKLSSLRFWSEMGLGNEFLQCGEDELFLISAIKRGYNCWFMDDYIALHPSESTGGKINNGILRGQGYIIGLIYPFSSVFRIIIKAIRSSKTKKIAFFPTLFQLGIGTFNSLFKKKNIPASSRW